MNDSTTPFSPTTCTCMYITSSFYLITLSPFLNLPSLVNYLDDYNDWNLHVHVHVHDMYTHVHVHVNHAKNEEDCSHTTSMTIYMVHDKQSKHTKHSVISMKNTYSAALGGIQIHDTLHSRKVLYQPSYQGS